MSATHGNIHLNRLDADHAARDQIPESPPQQALTLYFANGKVKVGPKYEAPLLGLATKAMDVEGYMVLASKYPKVLETHSKDCRWRSNLRFSAAAAEFTI